eukprot:11814816-Prorocentrum_lima.AAC.1
MTSSLVGSEMCIRDRQSSHLLSPFCWRRLSPLPGSGPFGLGRGAGPESWTNFDGTKSVGITTSSPSSG